MFSKEFRQQADLFLLEREQFGPLLLSEAIHFPVQFEDFHLGLEVDLVVIGCVQPVFDRLAILRHHNSRRLN